MHVIAAKAVAFGEALRPEFKDYQKNIVSNAAALAQDLMDYGFELVSGGTDNHMILIDLRNKNVTGKDAETVLDSVGVTVNKNAIPYDPQPPTVASGIRVGTPAVTSRGLNQDDMKSLALIMHHALSFSGDDNHLQEARRLSAELCRRYPLYV